MNPPPPETPQKPLRILICWINISGYMAACWRALAQRPDIQLKVCAFQPPDNSNTAFSADLLQGIDADLLVRSDQPAAHATLQKIQQDFKPDAAVIAGWFYKPYRQLVADCRKKNIPVAMTIDLPWRGALRQYASLVVNRRYVQGMDAIIVASEHATQYVRRFGVPSQKIHQGLYGFDADAFAHAADQRDTTDGWPRRFLFIGRYIPEKSIDTLIAGYTRYRQRATDDGRQPWALDCCGMGDWGERLRAVPGVTDHGFVAPTDLPMRMAAAGVFVLPSKFEPWGVALAEAMGAGMPAICTAVCGAADHLVRPCFNGQITPPQDPDALAHAMLWMDRHRDQLPAMGQRAQQHAAAFGAPFWAQRWSNLLHELAHNRK